MNTRSETGKLGEDMATGYLIRKGYKIIERNHREKWGEIDIVAKSPDETLVFFEVKTSKGDDVDKLLVNPEDQMTKAKMIKLKRTAALRAVQLDEEVNQEVGWRIDLLALTITPKDCVIKHYQNIS
ncbi:MAG: hypothetical protein A3D47_00125 [Candidatus Colwellbacteria bacterium RIFCSPHIGHO2_02_FULL_43_15]|uniref:UPF0102 protein A3D47_00125 n=1 Tax=Candidatus Colwellbacteria bacterium RIFCSPHIGHO2_02_FULL_43_15 TaxID=1797686 RepID=A0A1G1YZV8_9BACT|nr:MAG: hypothetical protein A3D47_00125 [Candidatus Colwellbacteria bacterium RIFCSPHIGHO2_02_FULL_43_15]